MNENPPPDATTLRNLLIEMAELFEEVVATLEASAAASVSDEAEAALRDAEERLAGLRARLSQHRGPTA
jgi:hypothetical protein